MISLKVTDTEMIRLSIKSTRSDTIRRRASAVTYAKSSNENYANNSFCDHCQKHKTDVEDGLLSTFNNILNISERKT